MHIRASVDEGTKYFIPIALIIILNRFYLFKKLSSFLSGGGKRVQFCHKMKWLLEHANDGNVSNQEICCLYGIVALNCNANTFASCKLLVQSEPETGSGQTRHN